MSSDEVIFRLGIPPEEGRYPGFGHSTRVEHGLVVERDVEVRMRDGVRLYVDVIRPVGKVNLPVILTYSPYGKHARKNLDMFDPGKVAGGTVVDPGMKTGMVSHYTVWEGPDPVFWCEHGFAVVNADARGAWACEGTLTFNSTVEGLDGYDLVEWAAGQPWSNGRVGMSGVSYLAWSQWNVAATQPPHLCAINPWEGYSDPYRDRRMHGGMRETKFTAWWIESTAYSRSRVEDVVANSKVHPLIDGYWGDRIPDLSKIKVPLYAVVDWGDHGIHTRGTIEGFKQASSREKWLEVHGRLKWPYFYRQESLERQLRFFDHFLRNPSSDLSDWTRVNIEVRESYLVGAVRNEDSWPIERTKYSKLFLEGEQHVLSTEQFSNESEVRYDSSDGRAVFDYTFEVDTELTGNMALKLWMESPDADDIDVFVVVDKLDTRGERVGFPFQSMYSDGPVALGWLRASHRELDLERSTPWQPWHKHERELPIQTSEPTELDIEILPSSTLFKAGETLRLTIQGSEPFPYPEAPVAIVHEDTRNRGPHVIRTGGSTPSHLVIPVVGTAL